MPYASRASHLKQSALDVLAGVVSYPGHRQLFTALTETPLGVLVNSRAELPRPRACAKRDIRHATQQLNSGAGRGSKSGQHEIVA